ncbi:MAG: hypothetical protein HN736_04605 [Anaerolineae bacterium]|jgi:hypothetical protein|nr:hypothetical protein [Anaerolineae bacterium]MBT3712036.1 hypothetical protein [Anaerolineae bacterium]MBT4311777.1 hypothetical protein [Anaerolineae bacterium]MBT4458947.1 hypothetical protein [Anaerolineae bacterium]MBT4842474.1 hypothetical protein [Anaerolineae bacterium]
MQSFSRGWQFLKQAWQMASADKDLIKPSIYTLFTGVIVAVIGIIPIVIATLLFSNSAFGQVFLYLGGALLVFGNFIISYIFSAMTVYLIYGYLSEGDGRMDKAWAIVKRDLLDLATLAAASTAVNALQKLVKGQGQKAGRNLLASLIQNLWTEASYLILPAMVIEDINLADGIKRATQIVQDNLLLVGISTVGVKAVTGLISVVLFLTGAGLGSALGLGIISLFGGTTVTLGLVIGIVAGLLVFFTFTMIATVISTYTKTAYHTCLYLWARDAEKAHSTQVNAPAPLAAVLD